MSYQYPGQNPAAAPAPPARRVRPGAILALLGSIAGLVSTVLVASKADVQGTSLELNGGEVNTGAFVAFLSIAVFILSIVWLARRKEGRGLAIATTAVAAVALLLAIVTFATSTSIDGFAANVSISEEDKTGPFAGQSDRQIRDTLKAFLTESDAKVSAGPGAFVAGGGSLLMLLGGLLGLFTKLPASEAAPPYSGYTAPPGPGYGAPPPGYQQPGQPGPGGYAQPPPPQGYPPQQQQGYGQPPPPPSPS